MALSNQKTQPYLLISPMETFQRVRDPGLILLDVRTPEEYNGELGHVAHTILIPVQELEQRVSELERYRGKTVVAICRSGNRSGKAAELLTRHGLTAMNMEGGMLRWNEEHLPVERGPIK